MWPRPQWDLLSEQIWRAGNQVAAGLSADSRLSRLMRAEMVGRNASCEGNVANHCWCNVTSRVICSTDNPLNPSHKEELLISSDKSKTFLCPAGSSLVWCTLFSPSSLSFCVAVCLCLSLSHPPCPPRLCHAVTLCLTLVVTVSSTRLSVSCCLSRWTPFNK